MRKPSHAQVPCPRPQPERGKAWVCPQVSLAGSLLSISASSWKPPGFTLAAPLLWLLYSTSLTPNICKLETSSNPCSANAGWQRPRRTTESCICEMGMGTTPTQDGDEGSSVKSLRTWMFMTIPGKANNERSERFTESDGIQTWYSPDSLLQIEGYASKGCSAEWTSKPNTD